MGSTPSDLKTGAGNKPALSVRNLTVNLPAGMERGHAVENISFDLMPGQILCIIGESGSGKSVTANAVMGLLPRLMRVSGGSILLDDEDLLTCSDDAMRDMRGRVVSMIFQDPLSALNPLMTVGAQVTEVMMAHGVGTPETRRSRAIELLDEVGLPDPGLMYHQYPFRLSGGQRQRVMIAIALALEPKILIADEPTTALDVTTQAQILRLIRDIQRRKGMSVMFITHDFGVVAEIADSVVVMEKGHIVEQGRADSVLNTPSHPYTKRLIAAVPRLTGKDRTTPEASDDAPILSVEALMKTYRSGSKLFRTQREVRAVREVSFTLPRGRTLGVVGESGSGKSSLGRLLVKLMESDAGQILFEGQDIAGLDEKTFRNLRPKIQMIFQDPFASLNPRRPAGELVAQGPMLHGTPKREALARAAELFRLVGLDPSAMTRLPHEFSGGQRQRIGLARALAMQPTVLVADEPVSALDVSVQEQVLRLLRDLRTRLSLSIVFITHDLRVAAELCDRIAVMHEGRIVEHGPTAEVFAAPRHDYTRTLMDSIPGRAWTPPVFVPT